MTDTKIKEIYKVKFRDINLYSLEKLIRCGGISNMYQTVLLNKYVKHMDIYKIADLIGVTKETAYNICHRAKYDLLNKLHLQYDSYDEDIQRIIRSIRKEKYN